ncbi:MAG: hypothetical protein ACI84R_002728 [Candidatus Azotimanducaceae bacterium]|jgi:hypothetical protein
MMQTWYGPVEDDILRYTQRVGFLASCFDEAAELARQYYRPVLLGIEQRYVGEANAKEYPINVIEYLADMAPDRSDDRDGMPDIEIVASNLIDKNPSQHTLLLERGPDVREVAWSHEHGVRSKFIQNEIGVLFLLQMKERRHTRSTAGWSRN